MWQIADRNTALVALFVSMICLGTWPALFLVCERKGRVPAHTYLDYCCSFLTVATCTALTAGQLGPELPNFSQQLQERNGSLVAFAALGGVLLMAGNLSLQHAIGDTGITVCLALQASITVTIGTILNYYLDSGLNNANILFPGVACFVLAIVLDCAAHLRHTSGTAIPPLMHDPRSPEPAEEVEMLSLDSDMHQGRARLHGRLRPPAGPPPGSTEASDQDSLLPQREEGVGGNASKVRQPALWGAWSGTGPSGLVLAALGGLCFSLFSPAFNVATNDQLHLLPEGTQPLTVYTAYFYFALSFTAAAAVVNVYLLYRPTRPAQRSSLQGWVADGGAGRGWALGAGALCGCGNALQFMGGQAAGYAAADLVQAYPLWSTMLGIVFFREFRPSSCVVKLLLAAMYATYAAAVALLAASARARHR